MQYHLIMAGAGVSDGSGNNGYFDNQASCYLVPGETGVARWWRGRVSVSPNLSSVSQTGHNCDTTAVSTSFQSFYYTNNKWLFIWCVDAGSGVTEYLNLVLWMSAELNLIFMSIFRISISKKVYVCMYISCLFHIIRARNRGERTQLGAEMGLQHQPQQQTSVQISVFIWCLGILILKSAT